MTVTHAGKPAAELRPLTRPAVKAEVLLQRWRRLPRLDPERLRDHLDAVVDPIL